MTMIARANGQGRFTLSVDGFICSSFAVFHVELVQFTEREL